MIYCRTPFLDPDLAHFKANAECDQTISNLRPRIEIKSMKRGGSVFCGSSLRGEMPHYPGVHPACLQMSECAFKSSCVVHFADDIHWK